MKKLQQPKTVVVIEWNGLTIDGRTCHNTASLEELARELGRMAARRDLAAARAREAAQCLGSDAKIGTISAKVLN